MRKKLNEDAMQSELSGSAFFQERPGTPAVEAMPAAADLPSDQVIKPAIRQQAEASTNKGTVTPRHRGPTTPPGDAVVIETIRRAVKQLGKEDATYRFTSEEKKALTDIVYTYGSGGVKTSQNEITRIALNWLLEDYRANGQGSVLARVLERLNQ